MKIKKGDKVQLLIGKDKGKTGKVLQIFPKRGKISVEGLNLLIKHLRPQRQGEPGQRVEFPGLVDISNAMLVCPKCSKTSRVGFKVEEGESKKGQKKHRICKTCKEVID